MRIVGSLTEKLSSRQLSVAIHSTGIVIAVAIVIVGYGTTFSSTEGQKAEWIESATASRELLVNKDQIIADREMMECELFALSRRLEELTSLIPDSPDESRFLVQLAELASTSKLAIENFRPGPAEDSHNVKRIRVLLTGAGTYECVCTFLDGLHALPRLTHVSRLKIAPQNEADLYPVEMELSIFFAAESAAPATRVAVK